MKCFRNEAAQTIKPAPPGTGVIAEAVRAVVEAAGVIRDVVSNLRKQKIKHQMCMLPWKHLKITQYISDVINYKKLKTCHSSKRLGRGHGSGRVKTSGREQGQMHGDMCG